MFKSVITLGNGFQKKNCVIFWYLFYLSILFRVRFGLKILNLNLICNKDLALLTVAHFDGKISFWKTLDLFLHFSQYDTLLGWHLFVQFKYNDRSMYNKYGSLLSSAHSILCIFWTGWSSDFWIVETHGLVFKKLFIQCLLTAM